MPVSVINMIPNSMSNETQRDAEPNITASFLDPSRIAASPFTPDPLNSGSAPIYISTDGGNTWTLNVVLPGGNKTGDTTLRFVGPSNVLYAGILRTDNGALLILRKPNFTTAGLMDTLVTKNGDDQPYVEGGTVMSGANAGADRVYVGENDFNALPSGHTATIDLSLDAATAPPAAGFGSHSIETRATVGQDGPSIRPAVHLDGTIYGLYMAWRTATTMDIVVVRDDAWGASATPFTALSDSDSLAGIRVATGVSRCVLNSSFLGSQRVGSQCAIAVDPRNSSILYIAWADGNAGSNQTIHVRRSLDRGATWSADIRTIATATNPGLAINQLGTVGFLYQQLHNPGSGNRWNTHLESWDFNLGSPSDVSLADVPDSNGSYGGINPIGDYAGLIAVGKNFYGIFSANNTPDHANFPSGVTYQRNADFTAHTLSDLANNPVAVSIDPFFAKVTTVADSDDFYVRDWTDSPASGDNGAEPSTHSVFYATSDVWNRRGTLPGAFTNDQPENEDAGNGAANIGDNWAFARIRRKAAGTGPESVTAHFLVSKFGTGSAYVDASSADPDVTFPDPDPTVVFNAAAAGPLTAGPVHWHLGAIASNHLCLAVEITGPNDPFVPPSLVGNTPGWPTTDLRIINDNNKAQRNMGLSTTPARGIGASDCFLAIVRNAATFRRDLELHYEIEPSVAHAFKGAAIEIVGAKDVELLRFGVLTLAGMEPGENRWIGLRFPAAAGKAGQVFAITFHEVVGGVPINGFAVGARLGTDQQVIREKLERHRCQMTRLASSGVEKAGESAAAAAKLGSGKSIDPAAYVRLVSAAIPLFELGMKSLGRASEPFRLPASLTSLEQAIKGNNFELVAVCHDCLLNRFDSALTMQQIANGDVANILHNVRWQQDLLRTLPRLRRIECGGKLAQTSETFVQDYGTRKATNADYPKLMRSQLDCLATTAKTLKDNELTSHLQALEQNLTGELRKLQRTHQDYLQRLDSLSRG